MTAIYASAAGGRAVERRYREILGLWPIPYERLTIQTREGDTFVVALRAAGRATTAAPAWFRR